MNNNLTFYQILDLLTDLIDKKTSGTLYIRSESNHVITIALDTGRIYALFCGPRRGRNAISMISQISAGSYKFEPIGLTGISHELPTTQDILNQLRTANNTDISIQPTPARSEIEVGISQEKRDRLCQQLKGLLAEHLGPIADMVFDEALEESADFCASPAHAQALINKLAVDIDDTIEVEQFRSKAYEVVDNMLNG